MFKIICGYLILINIITFAMYGIDKHKAVKHEYRISEARLIGFAVIGGSVGALAGMHIFHHKTLKNKFRLGLPFIMIVQLVIAYAVWLLF